MIEKIVTFHFVSGKSMDVSFSIEKFNEVICSLRQGWNTCSSIGDSFGVNFALVTHYEVKK